MPEGLADTLTRAELVDLTRFLAELGKVGPYSVGQARVVRRWQVLEPTAQARELLGSTRLATVAGNDPALLWSPAYSQVSGLLPLDGMSRHKIRDDWPPLSFARFQLDVSTGGKIKLSLNSATGVNAWLDGAPVEAKEAITLDVTPGLHTLTFAIDLNQ